MKYSGLTLALHGGVSGREEWPTLYGHHAACLGQLGCTPSGRKEGHNWCHVCYIHIHTCICAHTPYHTTYTLSTHTPGTGRGWWCSVSCHGQPFPSDWGFHSEPPGIYPGRTAGSTGIGSTPVRERNPSYSRQASRSNLKPCPWTHWCMWFLRMHDSHTLLMHVVSKTLKMRSLVAVGLTTVIQVQEYTCIHLHKSK